MKTQLILLFSFFSLFLCAQKHADYNIDYNNQKISLDITIQLDGSEKIIQQATTCSEDIALSFCVRNYMQEKLAISVNGTPINWILETSISNAKAFKINLSSVENFDAIETLEIKNEAFVDEIPDFQNAMNIKFGQEMTTLLTEETRTTKISF